MKYEKYECYPWYTEIKFSLIDSFIHVTPLIPSRRNYLWNIHDLKVDRSLMKPLGQNKYVVVINRDESLIVRWSLMKTVMLPCGLLLRFRWSLFSLPFSWVPLWLRKNVTTLVAPVVQSSLELCDLYRKEANLNVKAILEGGHVNQVHRSIQQHIKGGNH